MKASVRVAAQAPLLQLVLQLALLLPAVLPVPLLQLAQLPHVLPAVHRLVLPVAWA